MKVILADDHYLVLDGLKLLISTLGYVNSISIASNYFEMTELLKANEFQLAFLDIHFGKHDGRVIVKELKSNYPNMKVMALTSYSDSATIKTAINAGFDGYLLKIDGREQIDIAIQCVMKGEKYFSRKVQQVYFEHSTNTKKIELTEREKEILNLIVAEKTTKEIANTLCVSEKTIEAHRGNIMLKLEVRNIAGMVRKAVLMGIVNV
ncbi:response regulator [Paucihalobacter sp.]|uniref:response regulator n=1 Tax=Paucihalobacter sp. TaxID=2850405 RepID=UPI003D161596